MIRNIKPAARVAGMLIFSCFLSFFVYISFYLLLNNVSTKVVGYEIYEKNGDDITVVETVKKPPEKESLGDTRGYREKRTEMPHSAEVVLGVIQTVCGCGIVFCFVGSVMAKEAARDRNDSDFNGKPQDSLRGLKIGALSAVPYLILWGVLITGKLVGGGFGAGYFWIYRWLVLCPVKPVADLITGGKTVISEVPLWSVFVFVVFILLLVALCTVMYIVCYNEDSVVAKLLYKSTKKKPAEGRRLRH